MKRPEMILFDYGNTLLCEPGFGALRCEEAAFPYIADNPQNLTAEQIYSEMQKLFGRFRREKERQYSAMRVFQILSCSFPSAGVSFSVRSIERLKVYLVMKKRMC